MPLLDAESSSNYETKTFGWEFWFENMEMFNNYVGYKLWDINKKYFQTILLPSYPHSTLMSKCHEVFLLASQHTMTIGASLYD